MEELGPDGRTTVLLNLSVKVCKLGTAANSIQGLLIYTRFVHGSFCEGICTKATVAESYSDELVRDK